MIIKLYIRKKTRLIYLKKFCILIIYRIYMTSVIAIFDFTLSADKAPELKEIIDVMKGFKNWAFQLELSPKGYKHYQGRFARHKKTTITFCETEMQKLLPSIHIDPTSLNAVKKNNKFSYVLKPDTRIEGPWTDQDNTDEIIQIPIQYRVDLKPWQQCLYDTVMNEIANRIYRNVHVLYDPYGGIGKTTFALSLTCKRLAEYIPPCNDSKDIMRMAYCLPTSKLYIIDLTRSMNKEKLNGMYSAVEQIKNGYIYDDRYTFKRKFIDAPAVIIMTNEIPATSYLSSDRWKIHSVDNDKLIDLKIKDLDKEGEGEDD